MINALEAEKLELWELPDRAPPLLQLPREAPPDEYSLVLFDGNPLKVIPLDGGDPHLPVFNQGDIAQGDLEQSIWQSAAFHLPFPSSEVIPSKCH